MNRNLLNRQTIFFIGCIALFSILVGSCKTDEDDNSNSGYFIRFKANGTQVEFKEQTSLVAAFAKSGIQHNGVFSGGKNLSNIVLQVFDNKAIEATTFTGYTISGSSIVAELISYNDNTGANYTQGSVGSNATITISEITATTVRGTFSSTVKSAGKPDISITQGEFFVWRAN
jgi:hypothetical protein